jgi:GH15 family glucan-1,4-alpha-glucosidase
MLQYTLARDSLLVGFGSARDSDVSPLENQPQSKTGPRPAIFFAPTRDAHGLLTRKNFSHVLLVRRVLTDGDARAVLLPLPTGEWVADEQLEALVPSDHFMDVATCISRESSLAAGADIAQSAFEFESIEFETPVLLRIESYVSQNRLREQFSLENVPEEFAAFAVHWHQPEIRCSPLLQTTYASMATGSLVSYHAGLFFGVAASQASAALVPSYASCVQMQAGHSSIGEFACALSKTLNTLKQIGSGAPSAVRNQILRQWTTYQTEPIATGTSQGLMVWPVDAKTPFELTYTFASSLEAAVRPSGKSFSAGRAEVSKSDAEWLATVHKNRGVPELPEYVRGLYDRSLLTLKQMQDPTGGIIAAPEFQFEFTACGGYGYCWGRDAGFISLAMDTAGMFDESEKFYAYMAKCQAENGSFLHRHDMNGHVGPSWGLLQPDETGSVLFGLWEHVRISGRTEVALKLRGMVERAAQWLATCRFEDTDWICDGFDLWEEREGVHLYSVAAAVAGLRAAADLSEKLCWPVPKIWRDRAQVLSKLIEENLVAARNPSGTSFARTLFLKNTTAQPALQYTNTDPVAQASRSNSAAASAEQRPLEAAGVKPQRWACDYVMDISLLGVVEPFRAISDDYAEHVLPELCRTARNTLWRIGVGGIGRYEGDHYRDGQPWILTTLWLALAAARCGENELATECCEWVLNHTPREGQLPEQIDPVTGEPSWVMPLTWSHAMFVLACSQLPSDIWNNAMSSESAFAKFNNPTE